MILIHQTGANALWHMYSNTSVLLDRQITSGHALAHLHRYPMLIPTLISPMPSSLGIPPREFYWYDRVCPQVLVLALYVDDRAINDCGASRLITGLTLLSLKSRDRRPIAQFGRLGNTHVLS